MKSNEELLKIYEWVNYYSGIVDATRIPECEDDVKEILSLMSYIEEVKNAFNSFHGKFSDLQYKLQGKLNVYYNK